MDQDAAWGRLIIFFNDHQKTKNERTNETYSLVGLNSNNTRTRSHNIDGKKGYLSTNHSSAKHKEIQHIECPPKSHPDQTK